jgi:uncharacterized protein YjeT (DUF2065 family)
MVSDTNSKRNIITGGNRGMYVEYLVTMVGLICFFEGLPYLAFPNQLKGWFQQVTKLPSRHLRVLGILLMVVGLAFVYWGRRNGG